MARRSFAGVRAAALAALVALSPAVAVGGWAGWLRLTGNVHEFDVDAFRSGQLSPERLSALVGEHGIKTVVNLRGENPGKPWYDREVEAVRLAGADLVSIPLSANHEPDPATLRRLVETLRVARKPLLVHCEAGADRSGLASAIYELVVRRQPAGEADRQLSFRYGHFPWLLSRSGAMDRTFDKVVAASGLAAP